MRCALAEFLLAEHLRLVLSMLGRKQGEQQELLIMTFLAKPCLVLYA